MKKGDLEIWWAPRVMVAKEQFRVKVKDVFEAAKVLDTIADYDLFLNEVRIKPEYSNMGGLEVYTGEEWEEWSDYVDDYWCESIYDLINKENVC